MQSDDVRTKFPVSLLDCDFVIKGQTMDELGCKVIWVGYSFNTLYETHHCHFVNRSYMVVLDQHRSKKIENYKNAILDVIFDIK